MQFKILYSYIKERIHNVTYINKLGQDPLEEQ